MLKKLDRLVPRYAQLPIIFVFATNFLVYYGSRLLVGDVARYDFSISLDAGVPLWTPFILVYVLAYLQWVVGYAVISRESRTKCYRVCFGAICAKLICLLFFVALPTQMLRPEVTCGGAFSALTRLIYRLDIPINLFPSIHCLESWLVFRAAIGLKSAPRWYAPAMGVFSLLVMASTVLVKQHVLVDIPAGVLVAELGLLISGRLKPERFFKSSGI